MPDLAITADWTLDQLIGYLSSWSALQRYRAAEEKDPLPAVRADLAKVWGDPETPKRIAWRLAILSGRIGTHC